MNEAVVAAKLDALASVVRKIERKRPATLEELVADDDLQDILILNLAKAVQITIDIGTSIVAESDAIAPTTMRAVFDRLESLGELSPATADRLRLAVGFRNLAIHRYESIDWSVVLTACREGPDDLRAFAAEIGRSRFDGIEGMPR